MVKGVTTIQLFNSETGEKEHEYKKENLATNALSNIVNLPVQLKIGSNNAWIYAVLKNNLPLYKNIFGGIFLFNDHHDENVDNVMPDSSNKLMGFAGDDVVVKNDSRQGIRNAAESQEIENGYKFVWDFPTDKANGVIKSVSLTSSLAGNTGGGIIGTGIIPTNNFHDASSNPIKLYYPFESLMVHENTSDADGGVVFYIKKLDDGKIEMLYFSGGNSATAGDRCIYKLTYESLSVLKIAHKKYPYLIKKEKISGPISDSSIYNWSVWIDEQKKINITYSTASNYTYAIHKIYDLDGTFELEKRVTIPSEAYNSGYKYISYSGVGFANGKYYVVTYGNNLRGVCSFSESGQVIAISDNNINEGYDYCHYFYMNQYTGNVETILQYTRDGYSYNSFYNGINRIIDTGDTIELSPAQLFSSYDHVYTTAPLNNTVPYIDNFDVKPPYIPICEGNAKESSYCELFFTPISYYLATINNLETAITKTSAQTMKVIYELVEVD